MTVFAVGFLLLNAVLLALSDHLFWAGVCAVAAALAVAGWFWYRRTIRDIADARKEMKREVESLRALLHTDRNN